MSMPAIAYGSESYFLLAAQTEYDTAAGTADIEEVIYEFVSSTLRRETTPTTPPRMRGNFSPIKNVQGMVSAGGDIVTHLHATQMGLIFKHILHASAASTTANDSGSVRTAASFTTATEFSITDPDSVLTAPVTAGRLLFDFAATSGTGTIVITGNDHNDLPLKETIEFDLTGTSTTTDRTLQAATSYTSTAIDPTSDPSAVLPAAQDDGIIAIIFSGASGSGTISVAGDDGGGGSQTDSITVTDASTTTRYETTNNYRTDVMVTIGSGISGGTVRIVVEETGTAGGDPKSRYHYKDNVNVTITSAVTGNVGIDADPESYTHVLQLTNNLLEGLTIEEVKGIDNPNTYHGMLVNQAVLALADPITLTTTLIGRDGYLRQAIGGATDSTNIDAYTRPSIEIAPNWGMALDIDGDTHAMSEGSLTVNHNLDYPSTRFAATPRYPKPTRQGNRSIDLAATIDYSNSLDFDSSARGSTFDVTLTTVVQPSNRAFLMYEFNMPQVELVGFPDPEVTSPAELTQSLAFRAYSDTASGEDEMELTIISPDSTIP